MNKLGKPVQDFKKLERLINSATMGTAFQKIDFSYLTRSGFAEYLFKLIIGEIL